MPDDEILSTREAFARARETLDARDAEPVSENAEVIADTPQEETAEAQFKRNRDELGRFAAEEAAKAEEAAAEAPTPLAPPEVAQPAPTEPAQRFDAPARFSPDAKAAWEAAPLPIRAEVTRAFGELEKGLQGYREAIEPFRPLIDMAQRSGVDPGAAIGTMLRFDQSLQRDVVTGLAEVAQAYGTDLRSIAAHVMGQPVPEPNVELNQLRQQNAQMRQKLQGFEAEKTKGVEKTVQEFFASKPRAQELANEIAWTLKTGLAADLASAYEYADRLKPAPQQSLAPPAPTAPPPQTPAGPVSIKGAPTSGSNPGSGSKSLSSREAVRAAMAQLNVR